MDSRFDIEEAHASFRGVPFHVRRRERGGGRRGPTHEMPQRDEPDGEDLGRKCRTFRVEALLFGLGDDDTAREADAESRAKRLIAELEERSGPGVYRDPWHGSWSVICRTFWQLSDENSAGVVTLDISFEESGDTRYPQALTNTPILVNAAADDLSLASVAALTRTLSLRSQPQWVLSSGKTLLSGFGNSLSGLGLRQLAMTSALGIGDAAAALATLARAIDGLGADSNIGGSVANGVRAVASSSYSTRSGEGDPQAARTAWAGLSSWGDELPLVQPTTPTRQAVADNQTAIIAFVRRQAVAEEARALAASDWDSLDQATEQRAAIEGRLERIATAANDAEDDDVAQAARALQSAVVADVAARAPEIRRRQATLTAVLPARVVAYRLLGDATRADDIVTRNAVAHPLFMPAGRPLEYVSDG